MKETIKIAIASGKGGTGKTLVATNLLHALQQQNQEVVLVDCDAEEPNAMIFFKGKKEKSKTIYQKVPVIDEKKCTFCGKCHEYCNYNAIVIIPPFKFIKVMEDLCHDCGACLYACNYGAITEKDIVIGHVTTYTLLQHVSLIETRVKVGVLAPTSVIQAGIKEAIDKEIVIFDSPPGTSCPFIQTVTSADYVVLVTEPTPFGLSDLKQSIATLQTMNKQYGVIINRAGIGNNAVYEYLKQENIPLLMEIPFDKKIALHYSKGELINHYYPELQTKFIEMFHLIKDRYGNSSH
jgi:MinD superfamily P-loop ATPase